MSHAIFFNTPSFLLPRDDVLHERHVLLSAVDIVLADCARAPWSPQRHLDRIRRIELDDLEDRVLLDTVETRHRGAVQRAERLEATLGVFVGEDDIEREEEWAGVLAGDELGDLADGACHRLPTSEQRRMATQIGPALMFDTSREASVP